jgi:hypothetical protein
MPVAMRPFAGGVGSTLGVRPFAGGVLSTLWVLYFKYLMRPRVSDRSLESFKIFPYIAWVLIIGFGVFVYQITQKLEEVSAEIDMHSKITQTQDELFVTKLKNRQDAPK